jgi:hypothetical protein
MIHKSILHRYIIYNFSFSKNINQKLKTEQNKTTDYPIVFEHKMGHCADLV